MYPHDLARDNPVRFHHIIVRAVFGFAFFNMFLGLVSEFFPHEVFVILKIDYWGYVNGLLLLCLGYFVHHRSRVMLGLFIFWFGLDGILWLMDQDIQRAMMQLNATLVPGITSRFIFLWGATLDFKVIRALDKDGVKKPPKISWPGGFSVLTALLMVPIWFAAPLTYRLFGPYPQYDAMEIVIWSTSLMLGGAGLYKAGVAFAGTYRPSQKVLAGIGILLNLATCLLTAAGMIKPTA